jgi:hypothetical protein
MTHATARELAPGLVIRVATAPYFVAMKLEAFAERGEGDFLASHDLEDVIAVVDGNASLVDDVDSSADDLKNYLRQAIGALLDDEGFVAALSGHLPGDAASQARLSLMLERLRGLAGRSIRAE